MNQPVPHARTLRPGLAYGGVLLLLGLIMAGGYTLFRGFVLLVNPAPQLYGLWILSLTAGLASFFSPCAFPLLPSYLSVSLSETEGSRGSTVSSGLTAALGVLTFDLLLGLLIALLGAGVGSGLAISSSEPNSLVVIFRGFIGVVLLALGFLQLRGANLKPRLVDAFVYRVRPLQGSETKSSLIKFFFYGLGYTAAGVGCTGPILVGLIIYALGSGGFISALLAFWIFSGTMAGLMLAISLLIALSRGRMIQRLKGAAPRIKRMSAALLIGVGAFNVLSTIYLDTFVRLLFP